MILEHLAKYPLHVEACLYMLVGNGDRLSIGEACLVWRGYGTICRALYGIRRYKAFLPYSVLF